MDAEDRVAEIFKQYAPFLLAVDMNEAVLSSLNPD